MRGLKPAVKGEQKMIKIFGLISAVAMAVAMFAGNAEAWDNCGHGYHRNYSGYCVSNYGPSSGCPRGFHLGWNVERCMPNW
jgi:hypothetical protein